MPIFRKSELATHLIEFDDRCQRLREALIGKSPNANVFNQHALSPEDFERDFREIDQHALDYAIEDLAASLRKLRTIKRIAAVPMGR